MIHIEETDCFGSRLSDTPSPLLATLTFAGGLRDTDTGLIHFLFRDYDPATGFFIQPDPLGLRGGDVDVYGYCLDDPVNLVDPLGLMARKLTREETKYINSISMDWGNIMKQHKDIPHPTQSPLELILDIIFYERDSTKIVTPEIRSMR